MQIDLSKFLLSDDTLYRVSGEYAVNDSEFLSKIRIKGKILFSGEFFKVEDELILNASVKYTYTETCARCLAEFDNTIETKFEAVVVEDRPVNPETDEIEIAVKDGCVDLSVPVKQMVYLSMPMKALCREDCMGICPTCGVNLNVEKCNCENIDTDPRLEKLRDLLKE